MSHPYSGIPGYRRWRAGVADPLPADFDPVVSFPFKISAGERIATAGSCFAQHVARHLRLRGFNFLDAEPAHPLLPADTARDFGYGLFSARFGNIYTSRQLLQLLRRAYGRFTPAEDVWEESGRYFDPFRPAIQPNGFATRQEYDADRNQHFAAVRRMFEQADVFVFTFGLTEAWVSRQDGAAYPLCPGTVAGQFDPSRHAFVNLTVEDVLADCSAFITELREVNPAVKLVLTVSPVPLAATAIDRHVWVSTTASKAVLRVAAEQLTRLPDVAYFPSYEIVTSPSSRGGYYADDLRSIREEGVQQVMELFFRHVCAATEASLQTAAAETGPSAFLAQMQEVVDTMCDESRLDP
jgi:hypothetical protein